MRLILGVICFFTITNFAYAGKLKREFIKNTIEPQKASAIKAMKDNCGCVLTIEIKTENFKDVDELRQIRNSLSRFPEQTKSYCNDEDTKNVVCTFKKLIISKGNKSEFTFSKGTLSFITDGQSFYSFNNFMKEIDK